MLPSAGDDRVGRGLAQVRYGEIHEVVSAAAHLVVLGELGVETAQHMEVVVPAEGPAVVGVDVGREVVLGVAILIDPALSGRD